MDLHSTTITSYTVQPAPFDSLPIELKRMILPYLDTSPYSILALQLVSKSWYLTLTTGKNTDAEWERRCRAMGAHRRCPGCKTWKESWTYLMGKRCIVCSRSSYEKLHDLLPDGMAPKWVKVCEPCQADGVHPFKCTTHLGGLDQADRNSLPFKWRMLNGIRVKIYSEVAVQRLISNRRAEREAQLDDLMLGFECDVDKLKAVIIAVKGVRIDPYLQTMPTGSYRLHALVEALLRDTKSMDHQVARDVLEHNSALEEVKSQVEVAKLQLPSADREDCLVLLHKVFGRGDVLVDKERCTWLEAIAFNKISVADFIRFQIDRKADLEQHPRLKIDQFRGEKQACQSRVHCTQDAFPCEHSLCRFHHGDICDGLIHALVAKVTAHHEGEKKRVEGGLARRILETAHIDAQKADTGQAAQRLLYDLVACPEADVKQQAMIMYNLDGAPGLANGLDIIRSHLSICEGVDYHVDLDSPFRGAGQPYGSGKFTWGTAFNSGSITALDIANYERDLKLFSTSHGQTILRDFRARSQLCGVFIFCNAIGVNHGDDRCERHQID